MKSHQKMQKALGEIKDITGKEMVLYSAKGSLVACTGKPGKDTEEFVGHFMTENNEQAQGAGYLWYKISAEEEVSYLFGFGALGESDRVLAQMAYCQIRNLAESTAEQFDRNNFIQNVLLGNMLTADVLAKAKKLHIEPAERAVFVIDTGKHANDLAVELVKNLLDMRSRDFVTCIDEHSIILVKDVSTYKPETFERELERTAKSLADNLHMEAMIKVRVGYGNVVRQITEIAQSYQEAKMALEVGRVFYAERDTVSYGKLGIGRLIYQLPMSLCDMYIKEVFGDKIPEILDDEESMSTINQFFENNLNISETARQLYVHRNTLVYRLERIEKAIGLDIRNFDDAMTFRIAMMVIAHVRAQHEKEYK
jgi:carbohydrate diacid regulator